MSSSLRLLFVFLLVSLGCALGNDQLSYFNQQIKNFQGSLLRRCPSLVRTFNCGQLYTGSQALIGRRKRANADAESVQVKFARATANYLETLTGFCDEVPKPCPQGFQQFGSSCYYFKSVGGSALSWDQARTKCRSLSADLVSIETKEEHEFIKKNLKPITTPNIFQGWYVGGKRRTVDPATRRPWTAAQNANKAEMKKQYYWVATGKTMAYDGWEKSKADIPNVQPVGDPCVLLWVGRSDFLDYEFDDYVCASNYPNIGYVCEKTN